MCLKVETGIQDNRDIHISNGLEAGVQIVSGPYDMVARKLEDGKQVEIVE